MIIKTLYNELSDATKIASTDRGFCGCQQETSHYTIGKINATCTSVILKVLLNSAI